MNARYVHVEVRELRHGLTLARAVAECAITLPTGEVAILTAQLRSDRAPYWRVVSIDEFGNPLVATAIDAIGEEEFFNRIATAAALWNLWDSLRSTD